MAYSNFERWAWDNNNVSGDSSGIDDTGLSWAAYIHGSELEKQIKLVSPIPYLIKHREADCAPFWYVRHGMRDRDTSFATQVTLFYAIDNNPTVIDANYKIAYIQPHSGNYDVQEAYSWLAEVLKHPEKHTGKHKCGM